MVARNNVRYQMLRNVVLSTLRGSDVRVMDAFGATEPVFDQSEDHAHIPPWVYGELSQMFFNSLCPRRTIIKQRPKEINQILWILYKFDGQNMSNFPKGKSFINRHDQQRKPLGWSSSSPSEAASNE